MLKKIVVLLFVGTTFLSCGNKKQTNEKTDTTSTSVDVSVKSDDYTSAPNNESQGVTRVDNTVFDRYSYTGKVAKSKINLVLFDKKDSLSGYYSYDKQKQRILLKGIRRNGKIFLTEHLSEGADPNGFFEPTTIDLNAPSGKWLNNDRSKEFSFSLTQDEKDLNNGYARIGIKEYILYCENKVCSRIQIPIVTGKIYPESQDKVNSLLTFKTFTGSEENDKELCYFYSDSEMASGLVGADFTTVYNNYGILSFSWSAETMAAYPSYFYTYVNIDINKGTSINLDDVIKQDGKKYIIEKCTSEMKSRFLEMMKEADEESKTTLQELAENLTLSEESIKDFSFKNGGITIHLDPFLPHMLQAYEPSDDIDFDWEEFSGNLTEGDWANRVK